MLTVRTNDRFLPEKRYTFEVLLGEFLGLEFQVDISQESDYQLLLPNGKRLTVRDQFFSQVKSETYLLPENVPARVENVEHPFDPAEQITVLFGESNFYFSDEETIVGIDLFASAFFMLTRWEEYVLPDRDQHGRFPANASLSVKYDFHDRPVVNESITPMICPYYNETPIRIEGALHAFVKYSQI